MDVLAFLIMVHANGRHEYGVRQAINAGIFKRIWGIIHRPPEPVLRRAAQMRGSVGAKVSATFMAKYVRSRT